METLLQPPLLLDGAAATAYRKAGMPAGAVPAFWALEHPDMAGDLVRRYTAAGCDVLYAPTFGLSPLSRPERSADELRDANRRLLLLTRRSAEKEAAGRRVLIAGDLAGVGLPIDAENRDGHGISFDRLVDSYAVQATALKEGGADLLVCETLTGLSEARAALLACRETGLPVLLSLTVDREGEARTGARLLPAVITLQSLGAAAVGLNCSFGPIGMAEWLEDALPYAAVPLLAKPAASFPGEDGRMVSLDPAHFAEEAERLLAAGASLLGGCCGAGPEHLALLRGLLDRHPIVASPEIDTQAAAGEREAFFLSDDLEPSEPLICDSELADSLIEAEEEANVALVHIACREDIDTLIAASPMSRLPIAINTDSAGLLEETLRRYPGRLLVDTMSEEDTALLEEIAARYGAISF